MKTDPRLELLRKSGLWLEWVSDTFGPRLIRPYNHGIQTKTQFYRALEKVEAYEK